MSLSEVDRQLLQRCLDDAPRAWEDFVDRFLGLMIHVADHTTDSRGTLIDSQLREDLVSEVFVVLLQNDRAVLRRFRRNCSLATYLAVIARRVIVRRLMQFQGVRPRSTAPAPPSGDRTSLQAAAVERIENRDEVEQLILRLDEQEARAVRMYHLEGKSYREIGQAIGLAENSIGSLLTRAREKMRSGTQVTEGNGRH